MVGFLFHGKLYGDNSIVSLEEIGEGRNALLCTTNKTECCQGGRHLPYREWYFPNETSVRVNGDGDSFYRDRDLGIVRLNRRHNDTSQSGIFRCEIPSSSKLVIIYIGIYHDGQGNFYSHYTFLFLIII